MASLGRMIGKAAKAVAPLATQNWRDKVDQMEAEALRKFQAGENALDRKQTQANADRQFEYQKERDAVGDERAGEQMQLTRDEVNGRLKLIDQQIAEGKFNMDQQQKILGLKEQFLNTEDPTELARLTKLLKLEGVDVTGGVKWEYQVIKDEYGNESIVALLDDKGQRLNVDGYPMAPKEDVDLLLKDPSAKNIAYFEEFYGPGSAKQFLQEQSEAPAGGGGNDLASPPESAATPARPPGLGGMAGQPQIEAFNANKYASPGEGEKPKAINDPMVNAYQPPSSEKINESLDRSQVSNSVRYVERAIKKGEWPDISTPEGKKKVERALESGKLEPQLASDLREYLNQR